MKINLAHIKNKLHFVSWISFSLFATMLALPFNLLTATDSTRHNTEAGGADKETCWDCVVGGFGDSRSNNFDELRAAGYSLHSVAVFSKYPDRFETPIELMDTTESPKLNAIGIIRVEGTSNVPPQAPGNAQNPDAKYFVPGDQEGLSSGVIFDSCLVLTNHHAVNLERKVGQIKIRRIEFSAGPTGNSNTPFEFNSTGEVVAQGDFQYREEGDSRNDWAIVRLDRRVYDANNPNDPRREWKMDLRFHTYGQPGGRIVNGASHFIPSKFFPGQATSPARYIPGQKGCKVRVQGTGVNEGIWKTDCPSLGGVSGSPIWNNSNEVIAITRGALSENETVNQKDPQGNDLNTAVPISSMFTPGYLQEIKDKYGCDNKTSL